MGSEEVDEVDNADDGANSCEQGLAAVADELVNAFQVLVVLLERVGKHLEFLIHHLPESTWPPIVSVELWDNAQKVFKTNTAGRTPLDPHAALMRGHVYCGVCQNKMVVRKWQGTRDGVTRTAYLYLCSHRKNAVVEARWCPSDSSSIRCQLVDPFGWDGVKTLLANRESFVARLREHIGTEGWDQVAGYVAAAEGALEQKRTELQKLGRRLGQVDDELAETVILPQMKLVQGEVQKLEAAAADARAQLQEMKSGEEYEASVIDQIYNWHVRAGLGEMPVDPDKMDWDTKRLAVTSSGVVVSVYPEGWVDDVLGPMPRMVVTWGARPPKSNGKRSTQVPRQTPPQGRPAASAAQNVEPDLSKQLPASPRKAGTAPSG